MTACSRPSRESAVSTAQVRAAPASADLLRLRILTLRSVGTAFERAPWVTGGSEFTPLNETRYCTQRPAQANSSFSVDTASWTPANYDLHYQTIIWTGANGVELNFTDPNRVEICITAPYTSACPLSGPMTKAQNAPRAQADGFFIPSHPRAQTSRPKLSP